MIPAVNSDDLVNTVEQRQRQLDQLRALLASEECQVRDHNVVRQGDYVALRLADGLSVREGGLAPLRPQTSMPHDKNVVVIMARVVRPFDEELLRDVRVNEENIYCHARPFTPSRGPVYLPVVDENTGTTADIPGLLTSVNVPDAVKITKLNLNLLEALMTVRDERRTDADCPGCINCEFSVLTGFRQLRSNSRTKYVRTTEESARQSAEFPEARTRPIELE